MKRDKEWIFVTQLSGGYTSVTPDGNEIEHTGLSLYLGVGRGATPEDAFTEIYGRHDLKNTMPELKDAIIHSFEIKADGKSLDFQKMLKKDKDRNRVVLDHDAPECEWCGEKLSTKGAARFSHLTKHVNFLVKKNLLTKAQAAGIRKVELEPEIRAVFEGAFHKHRRKENVPAQGSQDQGT